MSTQAAVLFISGQRLHEGEKVFRFACGKIVIPKFEGIGGENAESLDNLLCPEQRAMAACGDEVGIRDRGGINIKCRSFIGGGNHLEKACAVAGVKAVIEQT